MARPYANSLAWKLGLVFGGLALVLAVPALLDPAFDAAAGRRVIHAGLAAALAALGAAFLFAHMVRPLRRLTEAADIVRAGGFDHRIDLDRRDELGRLADALNATADRLRCAFADLDETKTRLEADLARRAAELAATNERLQRELERRRETEEALRRAKEMAESANETKTLFLATMSHELRTPLHAIIGFSEILEGQLFGPLGSDRYREYVADIRQSGVHLLKLINDILDVSRIEAGALELDEEPIDLPVTVEACFQMVDGRAQMRGVRLRQELASDLPLLRGDEVRVRQILVNLLDNGIKFTPEGGLVALEGRALPDGTISICVSDTGIGIAAEDLDRVMSFFGQADGSLARKHDGAGLGLPLAKALAEKHGGSLSIESEPGAGTRVTVRFPANRAIPRPPAAASTREKRRA